MGVQRHRTVRHHWDKGGRLTHNCLTHSLTHNCLTHNRLTHSLTHNNNLTHNLTHNNRTPWDPQRCDL